MADLVSMYIPDEISVIEYSRERGGWSNPRKIEGYQVSISVNLDKKQINYIAFYPPFSIGFGKVYIPDCKENTFANDADSSFDCSEYMFDTVRKTKDFIGRANIRIFDYDKNNIGSLVIKTFSDNYTMLGLFCVDHKYE